VSKALLSGKVAAGVLAEPCAHSEVLASVPGEYERKLREQMADRREAAYRIRRFARSPWFIDLVIRSASRFPDTRDWLAELARARNPRARKQLGSPVTYLRLLWKLALSREGKAR
jgi:flavin-dependent dehydrogenase